MRFCVLAALPLGKQSRGSGHKHRHTLHGCLVPCCSTALGSSIQNGQTTRRARPCGSPIIGAASRRFPSLVLPAAIGLVVSHGGRWESLDNWTSDGGSTDVKQSHMRVAFTCNESGQWPSPLIPKSILMFVQV